MTWIGLDFDVFHVHFIKVDAVNKETLCRPEYTVVMRAYACADEKRGRVHLPPALKKMERRKRLLLLFICNATLGICRGNQCISVVHYMKNSIPCAIANA